MKERYAQYVKFPILLQEKIWCCVNFNVTSITMICNSSTISKCKYIWIFTSNSYCFTTFLCMSNILFASIFHSPKLRWHPLSLQIKLQRFSVFSNILNILLSFYWIVFSKSYYRQFFSWCDCFMLSKDCKKIKIYNDEQLLFSLWSLTQFLHIEWNPFRESSNNVDLMMFTCTRA